MTTPRQPELMGNWPYGVKVPDRASLGHDVQREHPLPLQWRAEQLDIATKDARRLSAKAREETVLVESGHDAAGTEYFHRRVTRGQNAVIDRIHQGLEHPELPETPGGVIKHQSTATAEFMAVYDDAAHITGTPVNKEALARSVLSNQATFSSPLDETVKRVNQLSGPTTITDASIDRAFSPYDAPAASIPTSAPQEVKATVAGVAEGAPSVRGWVGEAFESAAAAVPKSLAEAKAAVLVQGPEIAETAGRVAGGTVAALGAAVEANNAYETGRNLGMGHGSALAYGNLTLLATGIAGYADGVAAATVLGPLEAEHFKNHDSGAAQHLVSQVIQGVMDIDMRVERRVGEALGDAANHVSEVAHHAAHHVADAARQAAEQAWQAIHPSSH